MSGLWLIIRAAGPGSTQHYILLRNYLLFSPWVGGSTQARLWIFTKLDRYLPSGILAASWSTAIAIFKEANAATSIGWMQQVQCDYGYLRRSCTPWPLTKESREKEARLVITGKEAVHLLVTQVFSRWGGGGKWVSIPNSLTSSLSPLALVERRLFVPHGQIVHRRPARDGSNAPEATIYILLLFFHFFSEGAQSRRNSRGRIQGHGPISFFFFLSSSERHCVHSVVSLPPPMLQLPRCGRTAARLFCVCVFCVWFGDLIPKARA